MLIRLSELSPDKITDLPSEVKFDVLTEGIHDDGESAEVALLLGSLPRKAVPRAETAVRLYQQNRFRYVIPRDTNLNAIIISVEKRITIPEATTTIKRIME